MRKFSMITSAPKLRSWSWLAIGVIGIMLSALMTEDLRFPSSSGAHPGLQGVLAGVDVGGRLVLRETVSGRMLRVIPGHFGDSVKQLEFSPDARLLASVGSDAIQLWDASRGLAGTSLRVATAGGGSTSRLTFSPDGGTVAAVGQGGVLIVWNLSDGSVRRIPSGVSGAINGLVFSPDGLELAAAADGQITIWQVATGAVRSQLAGPAGAALLNLAGTRDGRILAAQSDDGQITLWDAASGAVNQRFAADAAGPLVFSPDSGTVASVKGGQVELRSAVSGETRRTLPGIAGVGVSDLVYSPEGELLAVVGTDARIRLWDPVEGTLIRELAGSGDTISRITFSADRGYLASLAADGQVTVWDLASGGQQLSFDAVGTIATAGASSAGVGTAVAVTESVTTPVSSAEGARAQQSAANPAAAELRKRPSGKRRSPHNWKGIVALAVSPDGQSIGVAEQDGTVRVLDARFAERFGGRGHRGQAAVGVTFSANGRDLISAGRDSAVYSWDSVRGDKALTMLGLEHPARAVASSADGKFIASGGEETRVMLWDASTGKLHNILTGNTDFVNALDFSPDGQFLASGGADTRIRIWEVSSGTLVRTLAGHADEVNAVKFSPDGKLLASGPVQRRRRQSHPGVECGDRPAGAADHRADRCRECSGGDPGRQPRGGWRRRSGHRMEHPQWQPAAQCAAA